MTPKLLGLSIVLACASLQAHALGQLADVSVIDRSTGRTLPLHYHRGDYWVAGQPGAKYAIAVRNRLGGRVLAVTSVDGVNVLNGETAAWDQTGYVFGPHQPYQITGWRKSSSEIAAFEFSAASDSYAGRTGRPGHVGVIGVALFREAQPEPVAQAPEPRWRGEREQESSARLRSAPAPTAPAAANSADASGALADRNSADAPAAPTAESQAKAAPSFAPPRSPRLGTAHGEREASAVSHTHFARLQAQPNEVIRIRYDSRDNLIASGVIREPASYPLPNPFPQSGNLSYVPDPPRY